MLCAPQSSRLKASNSGTPEQGTQQIEARRYEAGPSGAGLTARWEDGFQKHAAPGECSVPGSSQSAGDVSGRRTRSGLRRKVKTGAGWGSRGGETLPNAAAPLDSPDGRYIGVGAPGRGVPSVAQCQGARWLTRKGGRQQGHREGDSPQSSGDFQAVLPSSRRFEGTFFWMSIPDGDSLSVIPTTPGHFQVLSCRFTSTDCALSTCSRNGTGARV